MARYLARHSSRNNTVPPMSLTSWVGFHPVVPHIGIVSPYTSRSCASCSTHGVGPNTRFPVPHIPLCQRAHQAAVCFRGGGHDVLPPFEPSCPQRGFHRINSHLRPYLVVAELSASLATFIRPFGPQCSPGERALRTLHSVYIAHTRYFRFHTI